MNKFEKIFEYIIIEAMFEKISQVALKQRNLKIINDSFLSLLSSDKRVGDPTFESKTTVEAFSLEKVRDLILEICLLL